jgi:FAD/FMN-containing dehydrogenase
MVVSPLSTEEERLFGQLRERVCGDVLTDATSRYLYATDASYHLIVPAAVARPRHIADLARIAGTLTEFNTGRDPADRVGLIIRSGGASSWT